MKFRENRLHMLCGEKATEMPLTIWLDLYLWYPYKPENIDIDIFINQNKLNHKTVVKAIMENNELWYVGCLPKAAKKHHIGIPVQYKNVQNEVEQIEYTFTIKYRQQGEEYLHIVHKILPICLQDFQKGDYWIKEYVMPIPTITDFKLLPKFEACVQGNELVAVITEQSNINIVKNSNNLPVSYIERVVKNVLEKQRPAPQRVRISLFQGRDKKFLMNEQAYNCQ